MNEVHLTGLEGTNPLGFLAALGVQVAFASESKQPRLWWSDGITSHAVVDGDFTTDRIAEQALKVFYQWNGNPALNPERPDGSEMPKGDELKLTQCDIRAYLMSARDNTPETSLSSALVAEGSLDKKGVAKPSDLYFAAGRQSFLKIAREVLSNVSLEETLNGLEGPWGYENEELGTLGWDVSDDRNYALRANDPEREKKPTNPGPEALAILGLSLHPVFPGRGRTLTQRCSGKYYSWPLWRKPASLGAVKSLLAHAYEHPAATDRRRWLRSWGIIAIFQSPIRPLGKKGYLRFGPPEVAWR